MEPRENAIAFKNQNMPQNSNNNNNKRNKNKQNKKITVTQTKTNQTTTKPIKSAKQKPKKIWTESPNHKISKSSLLSKQDVLNLQNHACGGGDLVAQRQGNKFVSGSSAYLEGVVILYKCSK